MDDLQVYTFRISEDRNLHKHRRENLISGDSVYCEGGTDI
jgi:hypothetical protein